MNLFRTVLAALFLFIAAPVAFSCSCSNNVPIQQGLESYRNRAVFKAHTYRWFRTADYNGQRIADKVLAVVQQRYWGLPWYWPSVVLIESSRFCGGILFVDQDYLVSGWPVGYGRIEVNECSRTQRLDAAPVDLRTMDGSHCAGPGGSILGHTHRGNDRGLDPRAPDIPLTFLDESGKKFTTRSDRDGVYELNHLPPGSYTVESLAGKNTYVSSYGVNVERGACIDMPVTLSTYSAQGRFLPGLTATAELLAVAQTPGPFRAKSIEPDGRFYFRDIPDGDYILSVTAWDGAAPIEIFYPGVSDRQKAAHIQIKNHTLASLKTLDFDPAKLPFVEIPVAVDPPVDSGKYYWRIQLLRSNKVQAEKLTDQRGGFSLLYGARGASYDLQLYGWSAHATEYGNCSSDIVPVVARSAMPPVHISIPAACR